MKLRVLIAEDEPLSREHLLRLLELESQVEIVAECSSGTDALRAIEETDPNLLLLDVRLPELDAFGVVDRLSEHRRPAVIFVTGSELHAVRAFETEAADYLLKPFDGARLTAALRRARERLRARETNNDGESLERLTIKSTGKIALVKTSEVDWLCAAGNYVEIHLGKTSHLMRTTVGALLARLPQERFAQISRSVLVNIERVNEICLQSHGDFLVVLSNGTPLRGSRKYRAGLDEMLNRPSRGGTP
jgi:two-component system LytT family response regulator